MRTALQTLPDRLFARARETPDEVAYLHQLGDGQWQSDTWCEVAARIRRLASAFHALGLQTGDRVAIMLPTSPEWEYCQHAALTLGGVVIGLDAHDSLRNLGHILELTQPRVLIAGNNAQLELIREAGGKPEIIIVAGPDDGSAGAFRLADLLQTEADDTARFAPLAPEQSATIVFTSGSTGQPKGIAYNHRQVALACDAILERFPSITSDARLVCWLPLSNLFQRIINHCAVSCGARSYFVDKPQDIIRLLPQIEPTLFIGVPRFFEKLYAGIMTEVARQPAPIRMLVNAAWAVGVKAAQQQRTNGNAPHWSRLLQPLANLVLRRLRGLMGSRLQFMVSGSAPMPQWLLSRFHGLGWLVLEAYGISENVMPVALNTPTHYRFGSVGHALPDNELVIAEDGELLVRGPGVFSGYYGTPDQDAPINNAGFLQTGDYARLDNEGYLWLEGRKSEVFKTSTGRKIAPAPIEAALKQIDYVDHAVILGRDRPYPVALLTISPEHPRAGLVKDPRGLDTVSADVAAACHSFTDYQRPGAVILSLKPLAIASGELTANLKIRRKPIEERFAAQIDELYRHPRAASGAATSSLPPVIQVP